MAKYERNLEVLDVRVGIGCFRIGRFSESEATTAID